MLFPFLFCALSWVDGTPDQVQLKGQSVIYKGEIVQYDDHVLKLKFGTEGRIQEWPISQIAKVTTFVEPNDTAGDAAIAKGEYKEAIPLYRSAIRNETREWAVDRIRGKMLKALRAAGDVQEAAEQFLLVLPNRSDAEIVAYGPFRWVPGQPLPESQRAVAKVWLANTRDSLGKMLAANWLLDSSDRSDAEATLEKLKLDPDDRVRPLAKALLLRVKLQDGKPVSKEELAEFRRDVDPLPNALRIGPQYVLAMAAEKLGTPADAALSWLMIPYVLGGPPDVQAQAMLNAAKAAEKGDMRNDARKIYRELADRYPTLAAGKAAKEKLGRP